MAFTGQLGTANSQLGNIQLGLSSSAPPPLTDSVTSTLTLTQTISCIHVVNLSVTSTLTITQVQRTVIPEHVSQTLSLTQTITQFTQKGGNFQDTLSLTQSITYTHTLNSRVNSNIFFTQTIGLNYSLGKNVTSNLNLTQTIIVFATKPVKNTLTLTQTITVTKAKAIKSTLSLDHFVTPQLILSRTQNSFLGLFQSIAVGAIHNLSVTSTLVPSQTITQARVKGITQNLTLTQSVTVFSAKAARNTLDLEQSILVNKSVGRSFSQKLILRQTITVNKISALNVTSVLAMDQLVRAHKAYNITVTSPLVLTQEVYRQRYARIITQNLNLTQTITCKKIGTLSVVSQLPITDSVSTANVFNLTVVDILTFLPYYMKLLGTSEIAIPTLNVGKSQRFTELISNNQTIVLPNPQFGDGEGNTGVFTVRRGMKGKVYTYVKKTDFRKLTYQWELGTSKTQVFRDFLKANNDKPITIRNWRGEVWVVHITTNPIEFVAKGRYANEGERYEVTVEFEGIRLN